LPGFRSRPQDCMAIETRHTIENKKTFFNMI
jgi:hypothetical protein